MNQMVSTAEFKPDVPVPMTRKEKLLRFAKIVRGHSGPGFYIFSRLEYCAPHQLVGLSHPGSAFAAAAADPILKDAGLADDTVAEAVKFFDLSKEELHMFSCDCGGAISNATMATRIESIAGVEPSLGQRLSNFLSR